MKILTAKQIRELDQFTIENEPISSYDLMERAAQNCIAELEMMGTKTTASLYICGKGNNGGDGLAMARMEAAGGLDVTVVVVEHMEEGTPDFAKNLYRLSEETNVEVIHLSSIEDFPQVDDDTLIVDAILGSGLTRPLEVEGLISQVVQHINSLPNEVISIDIPTGLFAEDNSANDDFLIILANNTFTIHCPKLSFLLPESGRFAGDFAVLDIGLMEEEFAPTSKFEYVDREELKKLLIPRPKFSHKGTFGHALLLAGAKGKMGAAQLSAKAALRSGAGLLTTHVAACGLDIMQIGVPEAMCSVDSNTDYLIDLPKLDGYSAIGIGPGIGTEKDTANVLKRLLQDAKAKLVIDADALNILSENKTWLNFIPRGTILTPHPKEFERLTGSWNNTIERMEMQKEFSKKYGVIVVLKGAHTCITSPAGQTFFNSTGNAGMATAGSGDVLTGILLGLLAQGYSPEVAAVLGVWVHGRAGDATIFEQTEESLMASDLIANIYIAFRDLTF